MHVISSRCKSTCSQYLLIFLPVYLPPLKACSFRSLSIYLLFYISYRGVYFSKVHPSPPPKSKFFFHSFWHFLPKKCFIFHKNKFNFPNSAKKNSKKVLYSAKPYIIYGEIFFSISTIFRRIYTPVFMFIHHFLSISLCIDIIVMYPCLLCIKILVKTLLRNMQQVLKTWKRFWLMSSFHPDFD